MVVVVVRVGGGCPTDDVRHRVAAVVRYTLKRCDTVCLMPRAISAVHDQYIYRPGIASLILGKVWLGVVGCDKV